MDVIQHQGLSLPLHAGFWSNNQADDGGAGVRGHLKGGVQGDVRHGSSAGGKAELCVVPAKDVEGIAGTERQLLR
ncbi:hypothetical protein [Pseudarthrobacter siccitolerans]|uniref:hypothetical protein n=1 Tax=Pseudarthrobacter siccitolerans TaxID=861266 RepID=UPI0022866AAF|nr:hypothetical protein [Pseudarthrobacter siccitolerans]